MNEKEILKMLLDQKYNEFLSLLQKMKCELQFWEFNGVIVNDDRTVIGQLHDGDDFISWEKH